MDINLNRLASSASKTTVFFEVAKSAAIALLAFSGSLIGIIAIFNSLTTNEVRFEPIKVPTSFEELGYTSEITTTRILDEVAHINTVSTSTVDTKGLEGHKPGDILTSIRSLPLPGIGDFGIKEIQDIIQGLFGIQKERISGDITQSKVNDITTYHVRIRKLPGNKLLVNFSTEANAPDVVKQISLKIVEQMDPVVAASYYRWNNEIEKAIFMLDEALRQEGDYDDIHALVDRAQIYIQKKKFDLAQIDLDRTFKTNSTFVPALATQSLLYNETQQYAKGLEFANKTKAYWPNSWVSFDLAGKAYEGLNRPDEAEIAYIETIKRTPTWWIAYDEISAFHLKRKKYDLAAEAFSKGLNKFPTNVPLLTHYADFLLSVNHKEQAFNYLSKAHRMEPGNIHIWITLLEVDDYRNDPLVRDIHQRAVELVKTKANDTYIDKLRALTNHRDESRTTKTAAY